MRPSLPPLALLAALLAAPVAAQQPPDPVADSIVRNLTRGLRIPGQSAQPPAAPGPSTGPVRAETTAPPDRPAVSLMVTFPTGSAALTPQAEALVGSLARALGSADLAAYRFRIEGHTDTVGSAALNQTLSERRAATVRDVLVARYGLSPARLEALGLGETQLLVPTPDGRAEARNRRVQVINLGE